MTDPARQLRKATATRAASQAAWVAAITAAVESGMTFAEVAKLAGVTRGRVSQIVGPTGRSAGRRKPQR